MFQLKKLNDAQAIDNPCLLTTKLHSRFVNIKQNIFTATTNTIDQLKAE